MVRQLDLKKPPSIAESIDWARALLLLGADDIDRALFERTMSIIVKHRTDIDLVAERVGVQLGEAGQARPCQRLLTAGALPPGLAAAHRRLLRGAARRGRRGRHRRDPRRVRGARASCRGPSPPTSARRWRRRSPSPRRTGASSSCSSTATSSAPPRPRRSSSGIREERRYEGGERLDLDELREAIRQAIAEGDDGEMRDPAAARDRRLRPPRRGLRRGRRRRAADPPHARPAGAAAASADGERGRRSTASRSRQFERHLRRELERALIERTEKLPPSRPLAELDRALPTSPTQDLAAVHRAVAQLKRRLATLGHEQRGRKRAAAVDVRRTMRASLETGGVPLRLSYRPKRPRRPEIYVLCDVSTSVTSASVFFLSRPARAPRLVPQAAQLRLHRADLRGDRGLRARARLPHDLASGSAARAASPTSPATPTTAASGSSSSRRSPRTSTRARP